MPIYAYRCESCGHAQDVLQKISDPLLTDCPACGAATFRKQVTAAGFQLKGSGWYATDFRNGNQAAPAADATKPDAATPAGAAPDAQSKAADPPKPSADGASSGKSVSAPPPAAPAA